MKGFVAMLQDTVKNAEILAEVDLAELFLVAANVEHFQMVHNAVETYLLTRSVQISHQ
jgi:hypothetical protein